MQLPKTAKNRNLETVRIRVLPPVLLAPLRRPSPAPLRRPATQTKEAARSMKDGQPEEGASEFAFPTSERHALVSERKLLPAAEVCRDLGITRQALSNAVAAGRIFAVDIGARRYYPAFYVHKDFDRRALETVSQLLGSLPGWSKWQFFTTPKVSLRKLTPLQALSRGKLDLVERAAKAFAE